MPSCLELPLYTPHGDQESYHGRAWPVTQATGLWKWLMSLISDASRVLRLILMTKGVFSLPPISCLTLLPSPTPSSLTKHNLNELRRGAPVLRYDGMLYWVAERGRGTVVQQAKWQLRILLQWFSRGRGGACPLLEEEFRIQRLDMGSWQSKLNWSNVYW